MEKSVPVSFGSSKLVPNVQDLAKQPILAVPTRYIREDQDLPIVVNSDLLPSVPIIDMQKLLNGDEMELELYRLHEACKEWGFFQLVNHGVYVERIKEEIKDFFELPMEEKKKFWQYDDEVEGFGQAFVVSDEQKLDWGDMFFMTMLPKYSRRPHLFPKLPQNFREAVDAYSFEVKNIAMVIFGQMEKALKIDENEITSLFEDGLQSIRINYYPPCPVPEKVIGFTPHSDAVGLTILLQVNEVDGLQIRKQGMWIPVSPLPNAFILNIGDILEIASNGTYYSNEHRATINNVKERLSIATFHSPGYESEFGPLRSLVTQTSPALYKRISTTEYFKGLFSRERDGRSYIDVMKLENEKMGIPY